MKSIIIKSIIIIASIIGLYHYDLSLVFSKALTFTAGNITNYILIIPFLVGFVIYRERNILIALASRDKHLRLDLITGISLIAIAIFVYVVSSSTLYSMEYHIYTIPLFVGGSISILFSLKMIRHLIFVLILLIYLQPPPGELVAEVAADLSWLSASLTQYLLSSYMPIKLETSYGAPALVISQNGNDIPFYVGEPSSGIHSMLSLTLFGLLVAYLSRSVLWKRVSIFMIGLPLFFILNVFRISIILVIWYNFGYAASEAFHSVSGMIMVAIGTIALLLVGDKLLRTKIVISPSNSNKCILCDEHKELGERFCLFCGRLLSIAQFSSNDGIRIGLMIMIVISTIITQLYAIPIASAKEASITELDISTIEGPETVNYLLPQIEGWDLNYAYRDKRVESVLNQDAALAYRYNKDNQTRAIVYTAIQISTGRHTWEASMVIQPSRVGRPTAEIIELKDIDILDIKARFFVYKRPNSNLTEAVLYWFERLPLRFGTNYEERNVQIIIWSYVDTLYKNGLIDSNDVSKVEELYRSLALPIKEHWNKNINVVFERKISKELIEQAPLLTGLITIPSIIVSLYQYNNDNKEKRAVTKLYKRLSASDKELIDIINSLKVATTENILAEYKRLSKDMSEKELINKLSLAKDGGFVDDDIININGEAKMIWKSNIMRNM
ncbi:MAG: exosortase/archaeosortase family protein [Candidatus Nitrosocaldaceae archaeon]